MTFIDCFSEHHPTLVPPGETSLLWGKPAWNPDIPGSHSLASSDSTAFYLTVPLALNCLEKSDGAGVRKHFSRTRSSGGSPEARRGCLVGAKGEDIETAV